MSKKVLIGLSGGVDSAVAAYLLKKQGYEVTGAFMRNWDSITNNDILGNPNIETNNICPQEQDFNDAQKTADELGIPLLRVDFIEEYWNEVFSYFLSEYEKGRTPNPDVFCNKYIKFEAFRKFAHDKGFEMIAMGHYAKRIDKDGFTYLYKAFDKNKDQSYFLAQVSEEQLKESLFPLSDITKPEVRKIAAELNLTVSKKKDSTGVCFIGERNFKKFLQNYLPAHTGKIIDIESQVKVGEHEGVLYYTIGQRRGLGIGGIQGFDDEPWIVVGKDVKQNILYVAQHDSKYKYSTKAIIREVNYLDKEKPFKRIDVFCKFRYRQKDNPVSLRFLDETTVELTYSPIASIAKGQIAVFYDGEKCLGGGKIDELYYEDNRIEI